MVYQQKDFFHTVLCTRIGVTELFFQGARQGHFSRFFPGVVLTFYQQKFTFWQNLKQFQRFPKSAKQKQNKTKNGNKNKQENCPLFFFRLFSLTLSNFLLAISIFHHFLLRFPFCDPFSLPCFSRLGLVGKKFLLKCSVPLPPTCYANDQINSASYIYVSSSAKK